VPQPQYASLHQKPHAKECILSTGPPFRFSQQKTQLFFPRKKTQTTVVSPQQRKTLSRTRITAPRTKGGIATAKRAQYLTSANAQRSQ
jgi:hypothetical protein